MLTSCYKNKNKNCSYSSNSYSSNILGSKSKRKAASDMLLSFNRSFFLITYLLKFADMVSLGYNRAYPVYGKRRQVCHVWLRLMFYGMKLETLTSCTNWGYRREGEYRRCWIGHCVYQSVATNYLCWKKKNTPPTTKLSATTYRRKEQMESYVLFFMDDSQHFHMSFLKCIT